MVDSMVLDSCAVLSGVSSLDLMVFWTCNLWNFKIIPNDLPIRDAGSTLRVTEKKSYKGPFVLFTLLRSMVLGFKRVFDYLFFSPSQGHIGMVSLRRRKLGAIIQQNIWKAILWESTRFLYDKRVMAGNSGYDHTDNNGLKNSSVGRERRPASKTEDPRN